MDKSQEKQQEKTTKILREIIKQQQQKIQELEDIVIGIFVSEMNGDINSLKEKKRKMNEYARNKIMSKIKK